MVTAMKAKDALRTQTLRMVKTSLKNKSIELIRDLTDDESIKVITTLVKQRKESIDQFIKGNRPDLAEKEEAEIKIIAEYLPAQMSAEELKTIVTSTLQEIGASTGADIGKAMKAVMAKVGAKADGKLVSETVKKCLGL